MRRILGIDPGIIGGWAILTEDGALIAAGDLPIAGDAKHRMVSAPLLRAIIFEHAPDEAIIEDVMAMPKQGLSSTFKFGKAAGIIEGVCGAANLPIELVKPIIWKRALRLIGADKEASRQLALRKWPASAALFARKKDHGRAEAALIGAYAASRRRQPAGAAA